MTLAALLLVPQLLAVPTGSEFTLALSAAAGTTTIGTVEARLVFDPALLSVERFTLAPGWLALPEPGYELVDNARGVLVETAGYPRGFTGTTTFGVVTFSARRAGQASVVVAGASRLLGAGGEDVLGRAGESVVTVETRPPSRP
ncbi:MAG TPA: hypothetical protein VHC68_00005, partial [Candidatus Paceibacterota bacterium]|nr:hypothetical protein [Candidatus Paceibacterota bacterium]